MFLDIFFNLLNNINKLRQKKSEIGVFFGVFLPHIIKKVSKFYTTV